MITKQRKLKIDTNRRLFLKRISLSCLSLPSIPLFTTKLLAKSPQIIKKNEVSKQELTILNDRPLNAETPPHLLDNDITPTNRLFVRSNGIVPPIAYSKSLKNWALTFEGELNKTYTFTMDELNKKFKSYTYQLVLECGGNGRAGFVPPTPGNQWTYGAVGCPQWHGIRLKDVLHYLGLKKTASFVAYYGHDLHPSGDPNKVVISRGVPLEKALEDTSLIAFGMNNEALDPLHGYPARLIIPGYPGSVSGKWLKKIWVRDQVHDGEKMTGSAYRMPFNPLKPGQHTPDTKNWTIIEKMPVKSLITFPKSGTTINTLISDKVNCRGFAWTGEKKITHVDITCDYGQTWIKAKIKPASNTYAWQRWEATCPLPKKGYYEIWSRATDNSGKMQPMIVPNWNPKGYLNNAMPRIEINVI